MAMGYKYLLYSSKEEDMGWKEKGIIYGEANKRFVGSCHVHHLGAPQTQSLFPFRLPLQ